VLGMLGIFLDQETTGLDSTKHNVIEIAFIIVDLATGTYVQRYRTTICQSQTAWDARDPISVAINEFSYEEIKKGKSSTVVCDEIISIFTKCGIQRGQAVFICQNPSFDRAFFAQIVNTYLQERCKWPYHWLDLASMYWVRVVDETKSSGKALDKKHSFSKDTIAKAYGIPDEKKPHKAMQGVEHLLACYETIVGFPEKVGA